jgi:hypothetical protein
LCKGCTLGISWKGHTDTRAHAPPRALTLAPAHSHSSPRTLTPPPRQCAAHCAAPATCPADRGSRRVAPAPGTAARPLCWNWGLISTPLKKKKATYKSASARVLLDLRDSPNARLVNGSTASNPKSQNQDERLRSLYLPTRSERLRDCSLGRGVADGGGSRGFLSYKAGLTICLGGV